MKTSKKNVIILFPFKKKFDFGVENPDDWTIYNEKIPLTYDILKNERLKQIYDFKTKLYYLKLFGNIGKISPNLPNKYCKLLQEMPTYPKYPSLQVRSIQSINDIIIRKRKKTNRSSE